MRKLSWLLTTEVKQGISYFLILFLTSLVLGISTSLDLKAERKIAEISSEEDWGADLAVIPKGMSLIEFKRELLSGKTTAFLPEALFDTTLSLSKGQFEATAVLAITDSQGTRVMAKGDIDKTGTYWLKEKQTVTSWQDQDTYSTPEWKNKVIAGIFFRGPEPAIKGLKELIDRRTVAQAINIQNQIQLDQETREQLQKALTVYSGVMIALIALSLVLIYLWLKSRISSSLKIFDEIGFSNLNAKFFVLGLLALFVILPVALGFFTTGQLYTL
jgi:hypothetical protein